MRGTSIRVFQRCQLLADAISADHSHSDKVRGVALSGDGQRSVSASDDYMLKVPFVPTVPGSRTGNSKQSKTTLLNILVDSIPDDERILLIEDTAELNIHKSNLVRFETRREQTGLPAVTVRDLLKAAASRHPTCILTGLDC